MKLFTIEGEEAGTVTLPSQFSEPVREDLIWRAAIAAQANKRQPYGTDPRAGMKASANVSRRRRHYRGSYGIGISRVPRKIMSHKGTQFNWQGAVAPGTVKGRRAHPPKSEKIWSKALNKKERRKAIRSALSATMNTELVGKKHIIPKQYPFGLTADFEKLSKTKEIASAFSSLGLAEELKRCSTRKIRAGKATMRGRKYKTRVGPLVVVNDARCSLSKAARNIPGVEVVGIKNVNVQSLTKGAEPGRLTLFTETALKTLAEGKLYV